MSNQSDININEIIISGNRRTKLDFFNIEMQNIKTSMKYHNLRNELELVKNRLLSMNMFDKVEIDIQEVNNTNNDINHDKNKVDLKIYVEEKGIPYLKMSSYIKSGSGPEQVGFEVQGALRNPLGYGETYKLSSTTSAIGTKEFLSTLSIPNIHKNQSTLNISFKSVDDNQQYYSSYKQHVDSLMIDINSKNNKQQLIAEYAVRDEIPLLNIIPLTTQDHSTSDPSKNNISNKNIFSQIPNFMFSSPTNQNSNELILYPSLVTTNSLRPSLKTSLKYVNTLIDTRDSASNPSKGSFLQGNIELAFPPGTAKFCKAELNVQQHYTIGPPVITTSSMNHQPQQQPGLVASICGSLGILYPLFSNSTSHKSTCTTHIKHGNTFLSDRYHLGGPNSLRGFSMNGTGPRAQRVISSMKTHEDPTTATTSSVVDLKNNYIQSDSLGGDIKSTLLATLSTPIPLRLLANNQGRAFIFLNGGSISNIHGSLLGINDDDMNLNPSTSLYHSLLRNIRVSIGVGVSISVADAMRLELSYAIPIIKSSQDQTKAFQLGIGISMN